ncbi:HAD-IA family hydrolase [Thalassotalea ponticola]|uniref:HAD family hydrolase n=1 Tax=Thalassotalea ponticola TaxID=1523392 RepID=UPI0025B380D7|nr:HAD-IA family hydrolase [Thalassotalea ponticola]MDN3652689.1 HAD-IA family hydrolase [Thalassotalea ponticola]
MLTNAEGVLFDLDGTLLDTARDLGECLNAILREHGFEQVAFERYRLVASDGVLPLLQLGFGEQLSRFDVEQLRLQFLDYYRQHLAVYTRPFDGIVPLINAIEECGLPWGVVTNKPAFLTDPLMAEFSEFGNSVINVSGDTLATRKPDPAPMQHASNALGVPSHKVWYFGDAERDIVAGRRANMTTVIAKWGYIKHGEDLTRWQADHAISNPLHILRNCD